MPGQGHEHRSPPLRELSGNENQDQERYGLRVVPLSSVVAHFAKTQQELNSVQL
jgi:hypothetical protein